VGQNVALTTLAGFGEKNLLYQPRTSARKQGISMAGKTARRNLDFQSAEEVIAEIENLQATGYQKAGNWNLSQICEHLSATLRVILDDVPVRRMPWLLRVTVGNFMVRRVLKKRQMSAGLPTLKKLLPTDKDDDDPEMIAECIRNLQLAADFAGPMQPHPLADITVEQWQQFSWIHAAHHLGFLQPLQQTTIKN
jgi:hypothetical protein